PRPGPRPAPRPAPCGAAGAGSPAGRARRRRRPGRGPHRGLGCPAPRPGHRAPPAPAPAEAARTPPGGRWGATWAGQNWNGTKMTLKLPFGAELPNGTVTLKPPRSRNANVEDAPLGNPIA